MRVLALNTVCGAIDVALLSGEDVLTARKEEMARGQDARLPGLVSEVLDLAGCTFADIDRLAVVTGPGSFTGIRIGIAYMRGLALGLDVPCIGISTLAAGLNMNETARTICAMAAKKRPPDKSWWVQVFANGEAVAAPSELTETELSQTLEPGINLFIDGEFSSTPSEARLFEPSAINVAYRASRAVPEKHPPNPDYARAPDAKRPEPK